jgi:Ca2+-transporting ATPase
VSLGSLDGAVGQGLSEAEAANRLAVEGSNELPSAKRRTLLSIALEILGEPMILLLLAASAIYFVLGEPREASILLASVVGVIAISIYQGQKTERALDALRDLASPRALVLRDGSARRIPGREVVRGDVVIVGEGDRIPADGFLLAGMSLLVDESLLTGESVPVRKAPAPSSASPASGRPGGDDQPGIYAGTLVVRGQGTARVTATGTRAEAGKIGKALETIRPESSRLQLEIRQAVRVLAVSGIVICVALTLFYGARRGDWLHGLLAGLTLAMAILPEEFPIVLTVFLAVGAWRISRRNVLTRRVAAIESLGAATVLCVDKTGTLTLNRMEVQVVAATDAEHDLGGDSRTPLPEPLHEILEYAILASQSDPADPMERAIQDVIAGEAFVRDHVHRDWTIVREYPLSPELLAVSHVWRSRHGPGFVVAVKGAPEAVVDLCHLSPTDAEAVERRAESLAARGLRVLGVGRARFEAPALPRDQHEFDFELLGLVGLADPVRPGVPDAIRECREAGIRVAMITGDYAVTGQAIARQIGLDSPEAVLTGPELDELDERELSARVGRISVFARVVPEQKLRIVRALQARGEVVAMTGDGVNDAPALAAAEIGIAMGARGTDVAREAAALVLLDDDFTSIVGAVRLGRRVFDNLRKAIGYLLAVHVPIAGMSLLPVLVGWPLVLLPIHVVFLELIIDPVASIGYEAEPEEEDVMRRPPRGRTDRLFSFRRVAPALLQGLVAFAAVAVLFGWSLSARSATEARALAFTSMVVANLALVIAGRGPAGRGPSRGARNPAVWWVIAGAALVLALMILAPGLRGIFGFPVLRVADVFLAAVVGAASALALPGLRAAFAPRPQSVRVP